MTDKPRNVRDVIRPTTLVEARRLESHLGMSLTLASETFQHTGSFKFRAAYNIAADIESDTVLTASSGNFGQALAYACKLLAKNAIIVMPTTSAQVKMDAVREHGGRVVPVDVNVQTRADKVAAMAKENPTAVIASAYDDPRVIAGNATLGEELAPLGFDTIVVPVGGGGMSSGLIQGLADAGNTTTRVVGAEPLIGNKGARSLEAGKRVFNDQEAPSIADGARTVGLGEHNWALIQDGIDSIIGVPEERIEEAVRLLFVRANLKAEPTGALALGALLTEPERFRGQSVSVVVTGGNVDAEVYQRILSGR